MAHEVFNVGIWKSIELGQAISEMRPAAIGNVFLVLWLLELGFHISRVRSHSDSAYDLNLNRWSL